MPYTFLSPLAVGLALALLLALCWRRMPRSLRTLLVSLELLSLASTTPVCANALVRLIESRVAENEHCVAPMPSTIVVLGAGFDRAPNTTDDIAALHSDNYRRALAGIALWRRTPDATLVFSGGGRYTTSESAILAFLAEQIGVPNHSIRREEHSLSTWENAIEAHSLLPALPTRIALVTSDLHLPRALFAFRAHGFEPCAVGSGSRLLAQEGVAYYLPQSAALRNTEAALHELEGDALYRWRARTAH